MARALPDLLSVPLQGLLRLSLGVLVLLLGCGAAAPTEDTTLMRFVVGVHNGGSATEREANLQTVAEHLRQAGAARVEPLEGQSHLFVTAAPSIMQAAGQHELIEYVRKDEIRKPY